MPKENEKRLTDAQIDQQIYCAQLVHLSRRVADVVKDFTPQELQYMYEASNNLLRLELLLRDRGLIQ